MTKQVLDPGQDFITETHRQSKGQLQSSLAVDNAAWVSLAARLDTTGIPLKEVSGMLTIARHTLMAQACSTPFPY